MVTYTTFFFVKLFPGKIGLHVSIADELDIPCAAALSHQPLCSAIAPAAAVASTATALAHPPFVNDESRRSIAKPSAQPAAPQLCKNWEPEFWRRRRPCQIAHWPIHNNICGKEITSVALHNPTLYAEGEEAVAEVVFLLRRIGPACDVRTHPPALVRQIQYLEIAPCIEYKFFSSIGPGKAILPQECRNSAAAACCGNFSGSLPHSRLRHMFNWVIASWIGGL
ncbi:hypothetical protein K438DRAFT_1995974 [Mycena galopus ATCC 62051]|nr:hypothetical protein K438DRAFT_1995974 [Mycena galopus ATCC 62051]